MSHERAREARDYTLSQAWDSYIHLLSGFLSSSMAKNLDELIGCYRIRLSIELHGITSRENFSLQKACKWSNSTTNQPIDFWLALGNGNANRNEKRAVNEPCPPHCGTDLKEWKELFFILTNINLEIWLFSAVNGPSHVHIRLMSLADFLIVSMTVAESTHIL